MEKNERKIVIGSINNILQELTKMCDQLDIPYSIGNDEGSVIYFSIDRDEESKDY